MYVFKFGKHKGKTAKEVMEIDSQYLLWIYSTFSRMDESLRDFVEKNKDAISKKAVREKADFLYDHCNGDVSIE